MEIMESNLSQKIEFSKGKTDELVMGYVKSMDQKIVKIKNETDMDSFTRLINKKADSEETTG